MRTKAIGMLMLAMSVSVAWAEGPQKKDDGHLVPPVWSSFYNAEQGPLPDVSSWKVELNQKGIVVRTAPGVDWSRYAHVKAGEVRYTGREMSLKPREIAQLTDLLQRRLERELPKVKMTPRAGANETLLVDANITDAKTVNRLWNASITTMGVAGDVAGGDEGAAVVVAWIRQSPQGAPLAAIEMRDQGRKYELVLNWFRTGQIRAMLREDSHTVAWAVGELSREAASVKAKK